VVLDPQPDVSLSTKGRVSPLENEIPSYRAISVQAILSMLLGILSILSIASLWFLIPAGAAVLIGWLALRRIRRYPDILTGAGLARVGMGLALLSALASTTSHGVQILMLRSQASSFARNLAEVLKTKDFPTLVWYREHPEQRKGKSGQDVLDELQKNMSDPTMFEVEFRPLRELKSKIDLEKLDVSYVGLEQVDTVELMPYAYALYELRGSETKTPETDPQYALVHIKAHVEGGRYQWWFDEIVYPYQKGTKEAPAPEIDDGHGHAH
jgi:hypothetical protein